MAVAICEDPKMAILCDYFAAADDDAAATVLELAAGPTSAPGHTTVSLPGIEPMVTMQTLEELLTGRSEDEVTENPRQGDIIADGPDGSMIVAITAELQAGLVAADDDRLRQVAIDWAGTEELDGFDSDFLADALVDLADLARTAADRGDALYCWLNE
jgi:hypothetical protein